MSHTTFVHPEKHLLFSIQGRKRLARLSDRVSYIHWDNTTSTIRIYGTEEQQSQAVAELSALVDELKTIVTVSLFIKKESIREVKQNAKKTQAATKVEEFRVFGRRIAASGTAGAIASLESALKHALCPKPANGAKCQIVTIGTQGECQICFDELDQPYTLQMCNHTFCTGCIQPMFGLDNVNVPLQCPICNSSIVLRDVISLAEPLALERIKQQSVANFVKLHPGKYQSCFKQGCNQLLKIGNQLSPLQEAQQGGQPVECDVCAEKYCRACKNVGKPVELHRGMTCAKKKKELELNPAVPLHVSHVLDDLCMHKCPRCKQIFLDFDGCFAVTCANTKCNASFCGWCLTDCGTDAHPHVKICSRSQNKGGYFGNIIQFNKARAEDKKTNIVQYLTRSCPRDIVREVFRHVEPHFKDIGVNISLAEIGVI